MRVIPDTFGIFADGGFLISLALIFVFEAGFAAVMLVLTSSGG